MSLLSEFFHDTLYSLQYFLTTKEFEGLEVDHSEWVHVDGEEGDHGKVKYFLNGTLIATKQVYGGDMEDWEWTDIGRQVLTQRLQEIVSDICHGRLK